ncbi:hypothetical protein [Aliiglaciecola sp. LCG003]|uniref:hypothetical protein n=1 Tax=Aliiglaciecola sp. LCG003 TaxID=3053655 RepID=UPI002574629E|nr:hypothetical protein [Aliiglaciecola sp. LCG003]WJG10770.1 hypothetical protein QR722_06960 [Aliiglaciecola sp. LCG003]
MSLFSKIKRIANKAKHTATGIGRTAARRASSTAQKHGRKLLKRAVIAGVASGGTAFGGPIAGATLAKLTRGVL